jgi:predicted TIM-barrel fold metal-dependent hydrolase
MSPRSSESPASRVRARLSHPVVDADAHHLEVIPAVLDHMREVAGPQMCDKLLAYLGHQRRTFSMTPEQRRDTRTSMPVWWPVPTENTLDRATTMLPRLLRERMDELGLDFTIVYPGMALQVITLPGMPDDDLRRASARAFNAYAAELYRDCADRMTPVAVIPMHTPAEAIAELEHAVRVLRLKAVVLAGDVRRPVPALARAHPELAQHAQWTDTFGIDSEYDYDPVWAKCVELGVAATSHTGPIGWATRASVSRHQYNQIGGFAEGGEALAKSLFFGGVTHRFPGLNFAFLEGGVAWGCSLYARMVEHWKKRGPQNLPSLDPARLDQKLFARLIEEYGHARVRPRAADVVRDSLWSQHPEVLDDWSECGIQRAEDIRERFVPRFWFGCEGDDRLNAWAFASKLNPFGARLNAMLGSDLGHFDVMDMRDMLEEAHELVDEGLISDADFRDFSFANTVRLHGGMNPDFFKGTVVEADAGKLLAEEPAGRN